MDILICPFDTSEHYEGFLSLIRSEGEEWAEYLSPTYLPALEGSTTFVATSGGQICGFIRALSDFGHLTWIVELLVGKPFRGMNIGRSLTSEVVESGKGQEVYVMSDADGYYEKQGYQQIGSIFRLR